MVTIHEVLKLRDFNNFRLVAGANGLDRPVARAGFIDHETADEMRRIAFESEMIFSNLPMIKDHPEEIVGFVQALIDANSACFAIKTRFFKEVPLKAIELANANNYPIFLFDDTYIDELIIDIDEIINTHKYMEKKVRLIGEILSDTLTMHQIRAHAYELNAYFKDHYVVCMMKAKRPHEKIDIGTFKQLLGQESLMMPYKNTYIMIVSKSVKFQIHPILKMLKLEHNFLVGISDYFDDLTKLDLALHQSLSALKYGCYKNRNFSSVDDMGIFQLMIPLMNDPVLSRYYENYVKTLESYDQRHHSELLETAKAFIAADGDIKVAADKMFQHSNTIRYRIRKIKTLLKFDQLEGMQYETLAIAIHLYDLHKNREKISLL